MNGGWALFRGNLNNEDTDNFASRYILRYIFDQESIWIQRCFSERGSQAVRLPKAYALPGDEVYIKRIDGVVMLIPKDGDPWGPFVDSLDTFSDDFMTFKRDQVNDKCPPGCTALTPPDGAEDHTLRIFRPKKVKYNTSLFHPKTVSGRYGYYGGKRFSCRWLVRCVHHQA
jgi:antitoxin VapB